MELKGLLPAKVGDMRQQLHLLFDQLLWVPQAALDWVWMYQKDDHFDIFPQSCTSNAPQILMNPSSGQLQWTIIGEDNNIMDVIPQPRVRGPVAIPYVHLQQEEEEGSSD